MTEPKDPKRMSTGGKILMGIGIAALVLLAGFVALFITCYVGLI